VRGCQVAAEERRFYLRSRGGTRQESSQLWSHCGAQATDAPSHSLYFAKDASPQRRRELEAFVQEGGRSLKRFCVFQAIRLDLARRNRSPDDMHRWPQELREPDSPGIDEFDTSHREEIEFLIWAQWIADTQLRDAASRAEAHGMILGLYRDLAVGSSAAGAETWSNPEVVVGEAHAGVPLISSIRQDKIGAYLHSIRTRYVSHMLPSSNWCG